MDNLCPKELRLLFFIKTMFTLGIDPGWASCGLAITYDGICQDHFHYVPRTCAGTDDRDIYYAVKQVEDFVLKNAETIDRLDGAFMERYVAYQGVTSAASEGILMFIGALKLMLQQHSVPVTMVRAADWKPKVCKYLVRTKGFRNPSDKFDKKFSIAAATALSGHPFKTDHEADAVCMSYLGEINEWNLENGK